METNIEEMKQTVKHYLQAYNVPEIEKNTIIKMLDTVYLAGRDRGLHEAIKMLDDNLLGE